MVRGPGRRRGEQGRPGADLPGSEPTTLTLTLAPTLSMDPRLCRCRSESRYWLHISPLSSLVTIRLRVSLRARPKG